MIESVGSGAGSQGAQHLAPKAWERHVLRAGPHSVRTDGELTTSEHAKKVEPWLSALLQAEFLGLLVGSGFTTAVAQKADAPALDMASVDFGCRYETAVNQRAAVSAKRCARGVPNLEDQIRAAGELIAGLGVLAMANVEGEHGDLSPNAAKLRQEWEDSLAQRLQEFAAHVLDTERSVAAVLGSDGEAGERVRRLLGSFLLTFASRTASRERLNLFTTNYDRILEYGCDMVGLRILDRFSGQMAPTFRASRLGIDMHYSPPGIRGEPRYLEGVVRMTKVHGSIDWREVSSPMGSPDVVRCGVPFGAPSEHPAISGDPDSAMLIYPNATKDIETLEYPYAELFRDFAAGVCQPNAVLFTYGYGFGDDHINRTIADMLTIPSTHLAILSYDDASGRIPAFCRRIGRDEQVTLLIGPHFGDLETLVDNYLPKPAIDRTTWRMVDLISRRLPSAQPDSDTGGTAAVDPRGEADA